MFSFILFQPIISAKKEPKILSYSEFYYDTIFIDKNIMKPFDSVKVSVKIKNISKLKGKEVVQLFLRNDYASVDPDFERLVRFKKIELNPSETKILEFHLKPKDLAFVNSQNVWVTEPGAFTLSVGNRMNVTKKVQFKYINQ